MYGFQNTLQAGLDMPAPVLGAALIRQLLAAEAVGRQQRDDMRHCAGAGFDAQDMVTVVKVNVPAPQRIQAQAQRPGLLGPDKGGYEHEDLHEGEGRKCKC